MDFSMNGPVTQVARLQQGFRQNVKNAGSETLESRRAAVRRAHRHVALLTCQSGKGTTPLARHSSTRVLRSHRPSRFRAGAPLRQWGTLVKSRAKRPIFAPVAPFVAGEPPGAYAPSGQAKFHPLCFPTESLAGSETLGCRRAFDWGGHSSKKKYSNSFRSPFSRRKNALHTQEMTLMAAGANP